MSKDKALFRLEREKLLLTGDIPRLFLKYALPGVAGLLFLGIQSVIDGVVLGRFVGANALASVNLILPCYSLISAFAIVMGIGCQTIVSISLGKGDKQEANDALRSVFLFLSGMSLAACVVIYLFAGHIASFLGANEVLLPDAVGYIRSLVPFFPLLCLMFFGDYIIKAMGHPLYATLVMGSTVVLNIILDLLFVGLWGWGVTGAGLATGIAFAIGACFNVPRLFSRFEVVALQRGSYKRRLVWNAFYNGSSEGMSELSVAITVFLFNITLMKYLGENGVAAFTAINYLLFIGTTVFLGISDGVIPIIGFNHGARQQERIKAILKLAAQTNFLIGIGLFLLLLLFGEQVIGFFFKDHGSEAFVIASRGVSIYCFAFLLSGLNILASGYFTAIGNAKVSVVISILRGLVFVAAGIFILPPVFGIDAIWYNVPIAEVCTLFVSFWLVKRSL